MARRQHGPSRAARGSAGFYAALPGFGNFAEFADPAHYRPAPDDWRVVITDIVGSTGAIADGRYKDVNMLAAAGIVAVLNASDGTEIPFVFGGDGATLLVPPESEAPVRRALAALVRLARIAFGLTLRAGVIPVGDLLARGRAVHVARFELSPGNHLALFSGGGAEMAESLIKSGDGGGYRLTESDGAADDLDLSGLSCRWEPLPSRKGVMLSILVQALDGKAETYRAMMDDAVAIFGGAPDAGNPVSPESLRFRWPPRGLGLEARALAAGRPSGPLRLRLLAQSLAQWLANRFDLVAGPYDAKRYREELRRNADYRRFDDTLRLVVDCTAAQADALERFLEDLYNRGAVAYGLHRSDSALMTCLVFSLESSDHLHFIDGNGGGFTLAARQLKAQLAAHRPRISC